MISLYYNFLCRTGTHFGGLKGKGKEINYYYYQFFFGKRSNLMILDLKTTVYSLRVSLFFLIKVLVLRGKILGVEKREFLCGCFIFFFGKSKQFFFDKKWLPGFFTNFRYFVSFKEKLKRKLFPEQVLNEYENYFFGVSNMKKLPSVVFFSSTEANFSSYIECIRVGLPVISFVDFFTKDSTIPFSIPGSVDDFDSIFFNCRILYNSTIFARYKEIYFFFKKSLRLRYLDRKDFLKNQIFYFLKSFNKKNLSENLLGGSFYSFSKKTFSKPKKLLSLKTFVKLNNKKALLHFFLKKKFFSRVFLGIFHSKIIDYNAKPLTFKFTYPLSLRYFSLKNFFLRKKSERKLFNSFLKLKKKGYNRKFYNLYFLEKLEKIFNLKNLKTYYLRRIKNFYLRKKKLRKNFVILKQGLYGHTKLQNSYGRDFNFENFGKVNFDNFFDTKVVNFKKLVFLKYLKFGNLFFFLFLRPEFKKFKVKKKKVFNFKLVNQKIFKRGLVWFSRFWWKRNNFKRLKRRKLRRLLRLKKYRKFNRFLLSKVVISKFKIFGRLNIRFFVRNFLRLLLKRKLKRLFFKRIVFKTILLKKVLNKSLVFSSKF